MPQTKQNPESTQFGEQNVTPEEKTQGVIGVFDSVADNYDIMNDLMSGGLHRLWKDSFVRRIRPRSNMKFLDGAGGTGDIAFRIKKKAPDADITVFDLNQNMLDVGRDRAIDKGWIKAFEWTCGNAANLPFEDNSFDVVVMGWVLAYSHDPALAASEVLRVASPDAVIAVGCEYTPLSRDELKEQGSLVSDGGRYSSADDILKLFGGQVARVYLRDELHPDDRKDNDGIKTIFQLKGPSDT